MHKIANPIYTRVCVLLFLLWRTKFYDIWYEYFREIFRVFDTKILYLEVILPPVYTQPGSPSWWVNFIVDPLPVFLSFNRIARTLTLYIDENFFLFLCCTFLLRLVGIKITTSSVAASWINLLLVNHSCITYIVDFIRNHNII